MFRVLEPSPDDEGRVGLPDAVGSYRITIPDEACNFEMASDAPPATDGRRVAADATNAHQEVLCVCGSGLKSGRCCELDPTFAAPPETRTQSDVLANSAAKALAGGDAVAAEARSLEALDIAPRCPAALWVLYQVRRRAGHEPAALALLQRLVTVAPNNVEAAHIANLNGPDAGNYFKVTAFGNGDLEVFNSRTGAVKKYLAR